MAKKVRMLTLLSVVHANASFSFTCHIQSVVALSSNISRCGLLSHYPRYLLSTEYPSFPTQISANWSPCFCPCPLWLLPSIGQRAQNSESSDEKSEHLDPWHKFWVFPDSPDVKPTSLLRCSYPCVTSSHLPWPLYPDLFSKYLTVALSAPATWLAGLPMCQVGGC